MPFDSAGGFSPFAAYTTTYLENLLVTNPGVNRFALSINASIVESQNPTGPNNDVSREDIVNELANRMAAHKINAVDFNNTIVDNAATIGAVAVPAIPAGETNSGLPNPGGIAATGNVLANYASAVSPGIPQASTPLTGPVNPVRSIGQVA